MASDTEWHSAGASVMEQMVKIETEDSFGTGFVCWVSTQSELFE